jgi:hypothetical protein
MLSNQELKTLIHSETLSLDVSRGATFPSDAHIVQETIDGQALKLGLTVVP